MTRVVHIGNRLTSRCALELVKKGHMSTFWSDLINHETVTFPANLGLFSDHH